jgi:queuine tRNA-ribosyltransferase
MYRTNWGFTPSHQSGRARRGIIQTPHGQIQTPAFIPVGTKAAVKSLLPETVRELGAQAVLANAYHLYLQPGSALIDQAGGVAKFMNWNGPTFTDSGGFQVLSLGAGFKKTLAMDPGEYEADEVIAPDKLRLAHVDDDGVTFKSHLDGAMHRFTPEISMQVQHQIGADIMMAFDELTTLMNSRSYQEIALERTRKWAERCIAEHQRLTIERVGKPYQALFGVIQGAQYEDLRRKASRDLAAMDFDGFGIGGAIDKSALGEIVSWVTDELPEDKPRHLLGIGEPDDIFNAVESGADTFDCVAPSRNARTSAVFGANGRFNLLVSANKSNFNPIDENCGCYTCANYSRAYLNHLFKSKEITAATLATIHNLHFTVNLVDKIRESLSDGTYVDYRNDFLARYYPAN